MYKLDKEKLLAIKGQALVMTLKKALIFHLQAGIGIFAGRRFEKGDDVGSYYGSLVSHIMTQRQHTTNRYGEAFMQVTRETCHKCPSWILDTMKDQDRKEYLVRIVPVQFCVMQYIYDGRYLPGDTAPELERIRQAQKNSVVKLYQTQSADSASDLTSYRILAI